MARFLAVDRAARIVAGVDCRTVEAATAEFATSRYGGAVARVQSRVSWEVGRLEREPSSSRESDDA